MKCFLQKCAFFALLASAPTLAAGDYYYNSCDPCYDYNPCCGEFYATVEALYWRVSHCPIGVAKRANGDQPPNGLVDEVFLYGEYDGGVRGRIGYKSCAFFTDLAYLYFSDEDKKSRDRDGFLTMQIAGGPPFDEIYDFVTS